MTEAEPSLPGIVVCPVCMGSIDPGPGPTPAWYRCRDCRRRYPVVDGIAVLLAERATSEPPEP